MLDRPAHPFDQRAIDGVGVAHLPCYSAHVRKRIRLSPRPMAWASTADAEEVLDWDDPDGWVEVALAQCRAQRWTLTVLHDLPTGAMRHLDRFLDAVGAAGGNIRQDFPPSCLPIVEGIPVLPLGDYVAVQTAASMPTNSPI